MAKWSDNLYHFCLVLLLVMSMSVTSIAVSYSKHGGKRFPYIFTTIVPLSELTKFTFSALMYCIERIRLGEKEVGSVLLTPVKSLNFLVPAIIYAFQNNLRIKALQYVTPGVAEVLGQLKLPITTILMLIFSNFISFTPPNFVQWYGIVLVTLGAGYSQIDCEGGIGGGESHLVGVILVVLVCVLSGIAGVYTEWRMKEKDFFWTQNIHLYFYGFVVSCVIMLIFSSDDLKHKGFFSGYSIDVFYIVSSTAISGILISLVMKVINNIARLFAHAMSIVVIIMLSVWILGDNQDVTLNFMFSTLITISGIVLYNYLKIEPFIPSCRVCVVQRKSNEVVFSPPDGDLTEDPNFTILDINQEGELGGGGSSSEEDLEFSLDGGNSESGLLDRLSIDKTGGEPKKKGEDPDS